MFNDFSASGMYFSFPMRSIALVVMVAFAIAVLFSFTLYINLRPAKAFFGMDGVINFLLTQAWEFVKAFASAFMLKFIANFAMKLLKKLEDLHVIRNILYYADALGFDQYIGNQLNKVIFKWDNKEDAEGASTNLKEMIGEANLGAFARLPGGQIAQLAVLGARSAIDNHEVDFIVISASKQEISAGEEVTIFWNVEGKNITAKLDDQKVPLQGDMKVKLDSSKKFTITAWTGTGAYTGKSHVVEVKVDKKDAPAGYKPPAGTRQTAGLTDEQQKYLLRGTIASLTSQAMCGGVNNQAIKNVAIYQAASYAGADPRQIDPSIGASYYRQMARFGDPYSSPYYQEINMRDYASTAEVLAKQAAAQEMQSSGYKVSRGNTGSITTSAGQINSFVDKAVMKLFGTQDKSADSEMSFSQAAGTMVGSFVADLITSVIFKEGGRLINENPVCGVGNAILSGAPIQKGGGINIGTPDKTDTPTITVNGESAASIYLGDSATIAWNAGNIPGSVSISGLGGVARSGSTTVTPTEVGSKIYEMRITGDGGSEPYGAASLVIEEKPPEDEGGGGGEEENPEPSISDFYASPNSVTSGESADLVWSISGWDSSEACSVEIKDGDNNIIKTVKGACESGRMSVSPSKTTNYTLYLLRNNQGTSGGIWGPGKSARITVTSGVAGVIIENNAIGVRQ